MISKLSKIVIVVSIVLLSIRTAQLSREAAGQQEATSIRLVDKSGNLTAILENTVDGRSPTLLMYDRSGRIRAAIILDSVTGSIAKVGMTKCQDNHN